MDFVKKQTANKLPFQPRSMTEECEFIFGDPTVEGRFSKYVKINLNGCWIWTGGKREGYGTFQISGKCFSAHRVAYTLFVGPISEGLFILHQCDNKRCVNPNHFKVGTHEDNMREAEERGLVPHKTRTLCRLGHNDWVVNGPTGEMTCGECRRERDRQRRRNPNNPRFSEEVRGNRGPYKQGEIRTEIETKEKIRT